MKHPFDRKVFFVRDNDKFLSLNEIQRLYRTGRLSAFDCIFDVDGGSYRACDVATGKTPKWGVTANHDPMLHDLPSLSEEDAAMLDELICEEGFVEMPDEPRVKSVEEYLASKPRIARMVANAEYSSNFQFGC